MYTGMDISVIVNNLGGTSCLEMYTVANSAIRYLGNHKCIIYSITMTVLVANAYNTSTTVVCLHDCTVDKLGVNVVRVYVGSLMTSLEMAGVSLTLLHMIPGLGWEELLGMLNIWYIAVMMVLSY